jgi:hypothetical protein
MRKPQSRTRTRSRPLGSRGYWRPFIESKLEAGIFTEESRKDGFPLTIQDLGKAIAPLGALKSFELLKREEKDGLRVFRYRTGSARPDWP